jgi:hypothetical protein
MMRGRGWSLGIALTCVLWLGSGSAAQAVTHPRGGSSGAQLSILGVGPVAVTAQPPKDSATATVTVLNASSFGARISVSVEAASQTGISASGWSPSRIARDRARVVTVTLTGLKAVSTKAVDAQLVVTGGAAPVAESVTITPTPRHAQEWKIVIFGIAGGAFLLLVLSVLVVASNTGKIKCVGGAAPGPKWSFDSWASTLTAVGAVVGTVLDKVTLPAVPSEIGSNTLVGINVVFGLLIVLGPFLMQAIRNPRATADDLDAGLWGYSRVLLVSYGLTCAAVVGQLAALALLGFEIVGGGAGGWAIVGVCIIVACLAAYYFYVTTYAEVTTDWSKQALEAKRAAGRPQRVEIVGERALTEAEFEWPLDLSLPTPALRFHARMP